MLVGDSIVYGGNEFGQADKLEPLLPRQTGWKVWPASAGAWAVQNEFAFLERQPELIAGADIIVLVINSGDFGKPSEWRSIFTHPRANPNFYLGYLVGRYLLIQGVPPPSPSPVSPIDIAAEWRTFVASAKKPVIMVAYSAQSERAQDCAWVPRHLVTTASWFCYDANLSLGPAGFRDGIHPNREGNKALVRFIAEAIRAGTDASRAP